MLEGLGVRGRTRWSWGLSRKPELGFRDYKVSGYKLSLPLCPKNAEHPVVALEAKGLRRYKDCDLGTHPLGAAPCKGCFSHVELCTIPKGPRTQIIGLQGPNTINIIVFGP